MPNKSSDIAERLSSMSTLEFLELGTDGLAYIKPVATEREDEQFYTIFAANGAHIASGQDIDVLQAIARQHNLIPLNLQ